jgi:hypothetical protein
MQARWQVQQYDIARVESMHADPRTGPHNIIGAQFNSQLNSHLTPAQGACDKEQKPHLKCGEKRKIAQLPRNKSSLHVLVTVQVCSVLRRAAGATRCWSRAARGSSSTSREDGSRTSR